MCGVPFHAVDGYIARLVKKGFRVAICDQVEDPRKAKGIVKREVVRVVSPGTLTDSNYLDAREPAFLVALAPAAEHGSRQSGTMGVALLDLSTGEFTTAEYTGPDGMQALADELAVLKPREIVVPGSRGADGSTTPDASDSWAGVAPPGLPMTPVDAWAFEHEAARRALLDQLRAGGLEGFGLDRHPFAVSAAGALVHYLRATQKVDLAHVRAVSYRQRADALLIDPDDAQAPGDPRRIGRRPRRIAARRARSDHHVDRQPVAPGVAAAAAALPRCHTRSARRRRGIRVSDDRSRQVPQRHQGGPGPRTPGGEGGARDRRAARSGGSEAVDFDHSAGARARCPPSARRSSSRSSRSSTTSATSATALSRR